MNEPAIGVVVGCTAARETQIYSQNAQLEQMIECLESSVSELINRLSPVLRDSEPVTAGGNAKEDEMIVPLAIQIRACTRRTGAVYENVMDILRRIEL
ncbi:MAG: hypothetical protein HN597_14950 [Desulfobacula sp.]|jgi:hypothetical protein|uniref:Uncharacterized protein n=1 Tax=uncultured marine virus TaxID=186617 RepID=A0A0F7L3Q0_9VIRU|nr:hypothetical protein [uncultured marine virus]MBT7630981.1 hypothetical protein [Desulfobacula sp.]